MITYTGLKITDRFRFPSGEPHWNFRIENENHVIIVWEARGEILKFEADWLEILFIATEIKRRGATCELQLDYCPFSRQERAFHTEDISSLKIFGSLLHATGIDKVTIDDPHITNISDYFPMECDITYNIMDKLSIFLDAGLEEYDIIIYPDQGAAKKYPDLLPDNAPHESISFYKSRDKNGHIVSMICDELNQLKGKRALVIDDICGGGGTFIEVGKKAKLAGVEYLGLMVSHGFFTNGKDDLYNYYNSIR